jgi:methionyl-tRNA formyltransferase
LTLKIIFAGTPDFAAASLSALLNCSTAENTFQVVGVYTQPDRPAGRGKKLLESPVKQLAKSHQIPVFQPENFKQADSVETLQSLQADLMIVAAYGLILPKVILESPRLGCINIHASLLPRWRGAAPIQRAIQAGDEKTGITIMQMDVGLDTGDMLYKVETPISDQDTGGSLHDRLADMGATALLTTLENLTKGPLKGEIQDEKLVTYAAKLSKQEAQINWYDPADSIARTVRAFNPWPVTYTLEDETRIRILEAQALPADKSKETTAIPGQICQLSKDGLQIQCGDGQLNVTLIQLPGAKAMRIADFVNGNKTRLTPGTLLLSPVGATPETH